MFYSVADFTMLNAVNLCRFVTLTLRHFITPQQCLDRLTAARECDILEFNSLASCYQPNLTM